MDFVYFRDDDRLTVDQAVVRFVTALAPRLGELVLFGRLRDGAGPAPYEIPQDRTRLVALPDYASVAHLGPLLRGARRACRTFAASLDELDAVWLFGPHPLSLAFARIARRRGVPVVLGVRQDFPRYIAGRASRRRRVWAVPVAWAHELAFRHLARRTPAVVVGDDLAQRYRAARRPHVLPIRISLIRSADVVPVADARARSWDGEDLRVLSVGRLDPEKNPLLLADVLAALRSRDPRWRLDVVGDGPLADALRDRAAEIGVADALTVLGYVANGPELTALYRGAHAFLHVSFTEGLPQVLFEAAAAGLPIVATDVGGVRAALEGGTAGLLVPPGVADPPARALERLRDDPALRDQLIGAAAALARRSTMDSAHDEILRLFAGCADAPGPAR